MKNSLAAILIIYSSIVFGQSYQLTVSNTTFTPLSGATPFEWPFAWDDEYSSIPFGFNFPAGETVYDSLVMSSNGWGITPDDVHEYNAYYVDLIAAGDETSASYKTDVVDGQNILKIEMLNAGFYEDVTGTARTSFQLWFYENGCWESHIGPSTIIDTTIIFETYLGPFIGYANYNTEQVLALVGPHQNPQILALDSIDFPSLADVPADGMVYRFCPDALSAKDNFEQQEILVYPNPADNFIRISHQPLHPTVPEAWKILDLSGKMVLEGFADKCTFDIDIHTLQSGVYFFQLSTGKYHRLVKQ
ncbi:MAG: T9SS type A sorting domain-containing protein [Bacteroidia bacterium]